MNKDYQILIILDTNIPETTGHQMTTHFPPRPVCFCTTWENQKNRNITLSSKAVLLLNYNNTHKSHFVQISVTLANSLSNCPVVQLLTVNVQNVGPLHEDRHSDAFSIRW